MTQTVVYGCGYVGLVVSACLAEAGFDVCGVEQNADRLKQLQSNTVPTDGIELGKLIDHNQQAGRLSFAESAHGINASIVFVCVGTAAMASQSVDLSAVYDVIDSIIAGAICDTFVFVKSTVPPGTCMELQNRINATSPQYCIELVYNPEFLREGADSVQDFIQPDRVVVGIQSQQAETCARSVYSKLLGNSDLLQICGLASAELAKSASNAMLAVRLAMMNDFALIAERCSADITDVERIVGADSRIGSDYLRAGCGFGGPCLSKDLMLLDFVSADYLESGLFRAILKGNTQHQLHALSHLKSYFYGNLKDLKGALWGLSFKPGTSDTQGASSLLIARELGQEGVSLRAFDPDIQKCKDSQEASTTGIILCDSALDAAKAADFVIICVAWCKFSEIQPATLRKTMSQPVMIDACNVLNAKDWIEAGFHYKGMGSA